MAEAQLLERDAELATMAYQWRRARSRSGSMVLVGGESGVGKTELVRRFADGVAGEGRVAWGACDPLHTPRPLGPLHDAADELGGRVGELLATGAPGHEVAAAVFDELVTRPTVLVVDDLQWADGGTLDVLRFLLRRVGSTRSLVIGTYRGDEVGAGHPLRRLLGEAARTPDATWISLRSLSVEAVAALIADRDVDAGDLHRLTGGNPFFVREVLAHEADELPSTIRDAVLACTAGLDDDARDLLELLACAPEAVPDRAVPALGVGVRALRALDETGLLQRGRRGVAFRHELCRLAVASAIPPGGESALHARMLEALESLGGVDAAVLTHHALGAGDAARILRHASLAGAAASRAGAHTQAAAFFGLALDQGMPASSAQRAELLERQADELYLTDRLPDAIVASERAMALRAAIKDLGGVGANQNALSAFEWYSANRTLAERHARSAVEALEATDDLARLGHAWAMETFLAMQGSDLERARAFHGRASEIAAQAGDRQLDARVKILDTILAVMADDVGGRQRMLSLIERDAEYFDEIYSSGYSNLVYLDVEQRRLTEAGDVLSVSLPLTVERDIPICNVWQMGVRARLAFLRGDWDAAVRDADEVLGGPGVRVARTWPHLVRGLVALRRGTTTGTGDLDAAWELAAGLREPLRLLPALSALAERAWLRAEPDARLEDAGSLLADLGTADGVQWSAGDLAVWLQRLGHAVDAHDLRLAEPHRLILAGRQQEAAAAWDQLSVPYDRALALVDAGDDGSAITALEVLDRLGADAVAARVRQTLRGRGVTDIPGRPRAATRANPAGLTARQLEVLELLDEGLTNAELAERLFISPKTADHHVSAILAKLRVASRREAADAARRLGVQLRT